MPESGSKGRPALVKRFLKEFDAFALPARVLFKLLGVVLISMLFGIALEAGLG
jgi:hypothetical protein